MLSLLHIENIAVISSADILFDRGFNVLTGETGAGKSIVIDAISAIMGERTSRDLIRTGAKSARVSAVFRELPELPWFREYDIYPDENGLYTIENVEEAHNIEITGLVSNVSADNDKLVSKSELPVKTQQFLDQ